MNNWDDFAHDCARKRVQTKCGVGVLLTSLDALGRGAVEAALANSALGHTSIYQALKKRVGDRTPNTYTIARHRRGDCQCDDGTGHELGQS